MSNASWTGKRLPPWAVAAIFVVLALAVGYACLEAFAPDWLRPKEKSEPVLGKAPNLTPKGGPPAAPPLTIGAKSPALEAKGWLNGPPLSDDSASRPLLVIDIWALW
jgi:hypothetical protein